MGNGEYSNLARSVTPGFYPKSWPVKYWHLSNYLDGNAEIFAGSLSKLYWAWFALILLSRILVLSVNVILWWLWNARD